MWYFWVYDQIMISNTVIFNDIVMDYMLDNLDLAYEYGGYDRWESVSE